MRAADVGISLDTATDVAKESADLILLEKDLMVLEVFKCWDASRASLFQTGWFVESLMTQTLIIHVIRTNKFPFLQSRASRSLTLTTLSILALGAWLPYSPMAASLGFTQLPRMYWPILMLTLLAYMGLTQLTKYWLLRKQWI